MPNEQKSHKIFLTRLAQLRQFQGDSIQFQRLELYLLVQIRFLLKYLNIALHFSKLLQILCFLDFLCRHHAWHRPSVLLSVSMPLVRHFERTREVDLRHWKFLLLRTCLLTRFRGQGSCLHRQLGYDVDIATVLITRFIMLSRNRQCVQTVVKPIRLLVDVFLGQLLFMDTGALREQFLSAVLFAIFVQLIVFRPLTEDDTTAASLPKRLLWHR